MRHYVSPFLVSAGIHERPHLTVSVERDAATVAQVRQSLADLPPTTVRTSHPEQRYRIWIIEDREILLPEHAADHVIIRTPGIVAVAAERARVAATIGIRVVRQLVMRGGEVRGGRCVHAAAVDLDGRGVLIAGHPGSGKTTVLTHLIEDHGARPVSNDRTALIPTDTGRWHAIGVPLAARFTPEGIGGSPTLKAALNRFEPSRGRHLVDGKIELTPWELATLFNRTSELETEVAQLVILTRSAQVSAGERDGDFVRHHLDFGTKDFFADDWLNLRSHLSGALPEPQSGARDLWERLAETVPVLPLAWTDPAELPRIAAMAYRRAQT
ncbi:MULTISPECIES: hypothetical protein [Prauserella salsuginis group]|uniref:AAA+ ATPase domain-containing protein n=1 Tax=Prauserella salsuginis TaxID=387889 RepID=A0ABW6G034_9PSEU|nr:MULTISPECIES: hypothetical protein [Prauserella salsuginis group]